MPRTKGSKNRPKTTNNSVSKTDYATQITNHIGVRPHEIPIKKIKQN